MKIRLTSDIHLDSTFSAKWKHGIDEYDLLWKPEVHQDDKDTILVIAGDIWIENKAFNERYGNKSWIARIADRFHSVVIVLGNHDYWDSALGSAQYKAKTAIAHQNLSNVRVLENDTVIIGDYKFLGGTLWTDFNKMNPITQYIIKNGMNDYLYIRNRGHTSQATPYHIVEEFYKTKEYIFANARRDYPDQKVIVVTHHAPSYQSVHERYRTHANADLNFAYYTELSDMMYDDEFQADFWLHGHTHDSFMYEINHTTVVCNPKGYGSGENPCYNPFMFLNFDKETS